MTPRAAPHTFPLPVLFVDIQSAFASATWRDLQAAVGDGVLLAVLQTPETSKSSPRVVSVKAHDHAPVVDLGAAAEAFDAFVSDWHGVIEHLMNRRWDLVENPYAQFCVAQDGILVHEDPLSWLVDAVGDDLVEGAGIDPLPCALLVPLPSTGHGQLAALAGEVALPHAALFDADLSAAAALNGQDHLLPLAWRTVCEPPNAANTLVV